MKTFTKCPICNKRVDRLDDYGPIRVYLCHWCDVEFTRPLNSLDKLFNKLVDKFDRWYYK